MMAVVSKRADVSTVVSILPYEVKETKPGLIPPEFKMPPVKNGDFELLIVERCHHAVYLDETRPRLVVPDPSDVVAESIVMDHKKAIALGYIPGESEPGLDWVSGAFSNNAEGKALFKAQHSATLTQMERLQMRWFKELVRVADDDFAKYRLHKFITGLQRTAAAVLGITNREWLIETEIEEALSKCKYCFSAVHPEAIICHACHGILDDARYQKEFRRSEPTLVK
jgi:hypothetical protein